MKVVLRTDVEGVGHKGDIVDISDGFAQNKLIPKGLAFKATSGAEREAERMRKSRELKAAEERSVAEEMAARHLRHARCLHAFKTNRCVKLERLIAPFIFSPSKSTAG